MRIRPRRAAAATAALMSCLLLASVPAPAAGAEAGASAGRYGELDAYVRERMEATGVPGLAYAVVGPDGPLHRRTWGADGRGAPVTGRTPFLWGSVAKPVAATAVMVLVQEGRLDLEDRVAGHLPGFRFGGPGHASRVTVRHLLNQTSGIPESAVGAVDCTDPDCPPPAGRLGALDGVRPLGPPGTAYAYSSANYLVLAAVVEAVTGRPYAEHVREAVFGPAGMDGAIADRDGAAERGLAPGHLPLWGVPAPVADGVDDGGAAYGYTGGGLDDLAAFAAFQLREGRTADGEEVLTPESVRLMREEGRLRPDGEGTGYGLGWRVGGLDAPLEDAVWHTGAAPGYAGMLFLMPDGERALVVEQNMHGLLQDRAAMQVGFGAARILAGAEPPEEAGSAVHHAVVWGTTGLAVLMLAAAVRAAVLVVRPPAIPPRPRAGRAVLWAVVGAFPGAVLAAVVGVTGARLPMAWVPDAWAAMVVAASAGALLVVLRGVLAFRWSGAAPRGGPRR
ncbi:serine hydrolase domain-containing protein [Nocardiopsis chromatogenes]|uniref:serine hydrolase domain-containing protein n=1 Tax=Nocardiopsis chromatogenes TaxID=280239 RepID=UPI00034A3BCC|nr:serine hydrolase domain-containing protein [Nocardiopsis chromatogenes]